MITHTFATVGDPCAVPTWKDMIRKFVIGYVCGPPLLTVSATPAAHQIGKQHPEPRRLAPRLCDVR
jgi:hypothetical protein